MYTTLHTSFRYDPQGISYVKWTILWKCSVTTARAQTVDTNPVFFLTGGMGTRLIQTKCYIAMAVEEEVCCGIPADYADKLHHFWMCMITLQKAKYLESSQCINVAQTMCRFGMLPKHTNTKRRDKTVQVKFTWAQKERFIVALAPKVSIAKLPVKIIFKEHCRVLRAGLPSYLSVRRSTSGWITATSGSSQQ